MTELGRRVFLDFVERPRQRNHQRLAVAAGRFAGEQRIEHARRGREPCVEHLLRLVLAGEVGEHRHHAQDDAQQRIAPQSSVAWMERPARSREAAVMAATSRAADDAASRAVDDVTDAANGANEIRVELAAKVVDMDVERVALDVAVPPVDRLFELRAREDLSRVLHELAQHHELPPLQIHGMTAVGHRQRRRVDAHFAQLERVDGGASQAPLDRANAREKLVEVERLDEVVVGARIEPRHAIGGTIACAHHEHGHLGAIGADAAQEREPVELGQPEVEHDELEAAGLQRFECRAAVAHPFHAIGAAGERIVDGATEELVVLYEKDAHATSGFEAWFQRSMSTKRKP